jgi:hypothetical protein
MASRRAAAFHHVAAIGGDRHSRDVSCPGSVSLLGAGNVERLGQEVLIVASALVEPGTARQDHIAAHQRILIIRTPTSQASHVFSVCRVKRAPRS